MNYEVVNLTEKTVAGLTISTNNQDPNMSKDIGGLWNHFYADGIYQSIPNKANGNSIGLYTNYTTDHQGGYDMMVCCEVNSIKSVPDTINATVIPAGKYAKFTVHGDVQQAVGAFWAELWQMPLDRKFSCDFEEYLSGDDLQHAEINIYISLN